MRVGTTLRSLAELSFIAGALSASTTNSSASAVTALLSDGKVQLGDAEAAYQKAKAFVSTLTNSQKIDIITGSSVTGTNATWTKLSIQNGAAGINNHYFVSGFSMPNAIVTTWNKDLMETHFNAIGQEFYDDGYNVIDGPVSSPLGRVPEGGRQPEGFSPDPYLSGIAMGKAIAGMQSAGVIAAGRHFLLNEQETNRSSMGGTRYSSNVDDKTLHEVYGWPFYDGAKAGMMSVMCAMNKVNDTLSCETDTLLNGLLKTEMGFPGFVMPDVSSQETAYGSANAGLDYSTQAGQLWTDTILGEGISNGSFSQARLDDMAIRNVIGYYYVGLDDGKQPSVAAATDFRDVRGNHSDIIRQVGGEALVLLKNNNDGGRGLPLNKPKIISLFGAHAGPQMAGPNLPFSVTGTATGSDVWQGHLSGGGGSGELALSYLSTPFQAISERAFADRSMIWWIMNDTYASESSSGFGNPLGNLGSGTSVNPSYKAYAGSSTVCLCFINAASGEGADRSSLLNTDQDNMILTVAESCNNTVVVANVAGPRVLGAWADHENVTAILYSGLLGEQSGNAIADVLYGDVNPSGKLAHTLTKDAADYPVSICHTTDCDFTEGVYLDYRYFDANNVSVLYPFGHGLSYTNFTYADGAVAIASTNATALASRYPTGALAIGGYTDLWDDVVTVSASVSNTGARDGSEVVQLYLTFPDEAQQPGRVLRGFEKVHVAAGATADVTLALRRRDVSFWDVAAQKWAVASGEYTVSVGASSQDIKGTATFTV